MDLRTMQSRGILFLVLAPIVALSLQTASAADNSTTDKGVYGYWKSIDKDTGKTQSIFRLWEDKGKLIGKIVKTYPRAGGKPAQTICSECSGAQKDKPVVGLIFLWGFSREDGNDKKWTDGKVLNPEDGKTYNAEVTLSDDGKTLTVYGYIRVLVKLGGTSDWKRPTAEEMRGI
jgi:uncharacterized protein (DUF2147 family)